MVMVGTITGCEVIRENHGHVFEQKTLNETRQGIGKLTPEEVIALIGPPSCVVPYEPYCWYYVSHPIDREAFFYPRVPETKTLIIQFNKEGTLCSMEWAYGPIPITISSRSTPLPSMHNEEVLRKMFRKIGRFPPMSRPNSPIPH